MALDLLDSSKTEFYLTYLTFSLLFFFLLCTTLFLQLLSSDCSTFLVYYKYVKLLYRAMLYRRMLMCISTHTNSHMTSSSEKINYSLFLPLALLSICSLSICICSFRRSLWFTRGTWVSGITLKCGNHSDVSMSFFSHFIIYIAHTYIFFFLLCCPYFQSVVFLLSSTGCFKFSVVLSYLCLFFYLITFLKQWSF